MVVFKISRHLSSRAQPDTICNVFFVPPENQILIVYRNSVIHSAKKFFLTYKAENEKWRINIRLVKPSFIIFFKKSYPQ